MLEDEGVPSLFKRCREVLGLRPGETLEEFAEELSHMSDEDRADLEALFNATGKPTEMPLR